MARLAVGVEALAGVGGQCGEKFTLGVCGHDPASAMRPWTVGMMVSAAISNISASV